MAILDRVKERIETDLSDAELTAMIAEAVAEIEARHGVIAAITVQAGNDRAVDAYRRFLDFKRPINTALTITVTEIEPANTGDAANETVLAADDYRSLYGGRTLERLVDGTNGRKFWAPLVRIVYTPISDQVQRDEVTIQMVQLAIMNRGLASERAGDWQGVNRDSIAERERLIASLTPRRGLMMA